MLKHNFCMLILTACLMLSLAQATAPQRPADPPRAKMDVDTCKREAESGNPLSEICKQRKILEECMFKETVHQQEFFEKISAKGTLQRFDMGADPQKPCFSMCDFEEIPLKNAANLSEKEKKMAQEISDGDSSDDFFVHADLCKDPPENAALDVMPNEKNAHFMMDPDDLSGYVLLLGQTYKIVQSTEHKDQFNWQREPVTLVQGDGSKHTEEEVNMMKEAAKNLEKFQDLDEQLIDMMFDEAFEAFESETRNVRRLSGSIWEKIDQKIREGPYVEEMAALFEARHLEEGRGTSSDKENHSKSLSVAPSSASVAAMNAEKLKKASANSGTANTNAADKKVGAGTPAPGTANVGPAANANSADTNPGAGTPAPGTANANAADKKVGPGTPAPGTANVAPAANANAADKKSGAGIPATPANAGAGPAKAASSGPPKTPPPTAPLTRAPTDPPTPIDPKHCPIEGRYVKECDLCTHSAQCEKGLTCNKGWKKCIKAGSLCDMVPAPANCDMAAIECEEDEKGYPDICKCKNAKFPKEWVNCVGAVIQPPKPIPLPLEVPIAIWVGKSRLDAVFGGNIAKAKKRIQEILTEVNSATYAPLGIKIIQCGTTQVLDVAEPYDGNTLNQLMKIPICAGGYANVGFTTTGGGLGTMEAMPIFGATTATSIEKDGKEDAKTLAHELGHNFERKHTHDVELDTCVPKGCGVSGSGVPFPDCAYADCTGEAGTLMSYCHACTGGLGSSNKFHPNNVEGIKKIANNYMDDSRRLEERLRILRRQRERTLESRDQSKKQEPFSKQMTGLMAL